MLVLSRKVGEELYIGDNIRIVINRVAGNRVSVGIEAPLEVGIVRGELKELHDDFRDIASNPLSSNPLSSNARVISAETESYEPEDYVRRAAR